MLSRADLSSSDSCWIEVTEYPRLAAAHPREGWKQLWTPPRVLGKKLHTSDALLRTASSKGSRDTTTPGRQGRRLYPVRQELRLLPHSVQNPTALSGAMSPGSPWCQEQEHARPGQGSQPGKGQQGRPARGQHSRLEEPLDKGPF